MIPMKEYGMFLAINVSKNSLPVLLLRTSIKRGFNKSKHAAKGYMAKGGVI